MKIYLVRPKSPPTLESLSEGLSWWKVDANETPLELATLAALTPPEIDLEVTDALAGETVQYDIEADLVAIVASPAQVPSLRYLAGRFSARRIPVALGGTFVTEHPGQARFANIKLIGDLEMVWPDLIRDWQAGKSTTKTYTAPKQFDLSESPLPRWDLFTLTRYRLGVIEVARSVPADKTQHGKAPAGEQRYKPLPLILKELELLTESGLRRIRLNADDILQDPDTASALFQALAEFNQNRAVHVGFECRARPAGLLASGMLAQMCRANVRKVEMDLYRGAEGAMSAEAYADKVIEANRALREHGIRSAGQLTLEADGNQPGAWSKLTEAARESYAKPWLKAIKAIPGTDLYRQLKDAGRIIQGARDAEFRQDLFDLPNYRPALGDYKALAKQVKTLVLDLYSSSSVSGRLEALIKDAQSGPEGDPWPSPDDVVALARMLAGTFGNPGEDRARLTARILFSMLSELPPRALWTQGLEALLEEAAARSFVVKMADGRPLDGAVPPMNWKKRAVTIGAKVMGTLMSFGEETPNRRQSDK